MSHPSSFCVRLACGRLFLILSLARSTPSLGRRQPWSLQLVRLAFLLFWSPLPASQQTASGSAVLPGLLVWVLARESTAHHLWFRVLMVCSTATIPIFFFLETQGPSFLTAASQSTSCFFTLCPFLSPVCPPQLDPGLLCGLSSMCTNLYSPS